METPAFNLHTLQELSFKRCKQWGEVLKKFEENREDDETEMNWSDVSTLFKDDVEKEFDDEIAHDEAVESDVSGDSSILKDVTNFSRVLKNLSETQRNSTRYSQLELPVVATSTTLVENNDREQEIRHLLDETIPVLQEHKRRLQESGIDRVLNTFDPQKVEEKVGTWLRRQNAGSAHAAHSHHPRSDHRHASNLCRHGDFQRYGSGSESDSLHSVDTARYIRSSRQKHASHRKITSGSSMTIKTFRLVKSKRDNLRQKYTVRVDADEEEALSAHRRCASHRKAPSSKYTDLGLATGSHAIVKRPPQRSKVLRKRRSITHRYELGDYASSSSFYSSDEDDLNADNAAYGCCARSQAQQLQKHQSHLAPCKCNSRRQLARQCQSLCCRRSRGRVCHMASFTSSSSTSFVESQYPNRSKKGTIHMAPIAAEDYRPWRRESDCECCNQEMLCSGVRHIADISTESWLVENYESPRKSRSANKVAKNFERNYETHRSAHPPVRDALRYSESSPEMSEKRHVPLRSQKQNHHNFNENHRTPTSMLEKPQHRLKESKAKTVASLANKSRKAPTVKDETDDDRPAEKRTATKTTGDSRNKETSKENQLNCITNDSDDEDFMKSLQLAIENSKKSFQREFKKSTKDEDTAPRQKTLCQKTEADPQREVKLNRTSSDCSSKQKGSCIGDPIGEDTEKTSKPRTKSVRPRKIVEDLSQKKPTDPYVKRSKDLVASQQHNRVPTGKDVKIVHKNSTIDSVELCSPMSNMTVLSRSQSSDIPKLTDKSLKPQLKSAQKEKSSNEVEVPKENSRRQYIKRPKDMQRNIEHTGNDAEIVKRNETTIDLCSTQSDVSQQTFKDITALTEQSLKPQPKSAKQKKLSQLMRKISSNDAVQNATFMQGNECVYNSTAIGSNDCTAVSRQFTVESSSLPKNKAYTPAPKSKKIEKPQNTASKGKARVGRNLSTVEVISEDGDMASVSSANDCTVVSSTTDSEPVKSSKGILLYAPDFTTLAPEHSIRNGYFSITEEHLGRVVDEHTARKFMKYHIGHKRFDCSRARVYFRPPKQQVISDSDSDVDVFERVGRYGELHVSIDASGR